MPETEFDTPTVRRQLLYGTNSLLFIAGWLCIVYAQTMVAAMPIVSIAHCSFTVSWNTFTTSNVAMAAVVIAAGGVSGYLMAARRTGWGTGALLGSTILCTALTILMGWLASWSVAIMLSGSAWEGQSPSTSLAIIAGLLFVIPGLAGVSTLIACWVLRRSSIPARDAARIASLVPALWFALAVVVLVVASVALC